MGSYRPNPWGLHDTAGNVWEWVWDGYDDSYYQQFAGKPAIDPAGPAKAADRVLRGGGWHNLGWFCRPAFRDRFGPGFRFRLLGFRLALGRSS